MNRLCCAKKRTQSLAGAMSRVKVRLHKKKYERG